jgi:hypothetical protein
MAKAIYGHTGTDPRLAAEIARLRARVRELEAEVAVLREFTADAADPAWTSEDWEVPLEVLVPDPR